jgi:protein gp37
MNSDFFFEGVDQYRDQCWEIMRQRPDIYFYLLTKRPERVIETLPSWWKATDFTHVMMNVTCENQEMADKRLPILKTLPFKRLGIMCAPLLSDINLEPYISEGWIENVNCGGENYDGARPCHYEWVKHISDQCKAADVKFTFIETGTNFYRDGQPLAMTDSKTMQSKRARDMKLNHKEDVLLGTYQPRWNTECLTCGSQPICQGADAKGIGC